MFRIYYLFPGGGVAVYMRFLFLFPYFSVRLFEMSRTFSGFGSCWSCCQRVCHEPLFLSPFFLLLESFADFFWGRVEGEGEDGGECM